MGSDIKARLADGKCTIGSWMQLSDASVAQIMGSSGYDWIAVDLEHGDFPKKNLADIFRALELGKTVPFARLSDTSPTSIKQTLDAGAKGLIFPMIESGEQLADAISWALYPPEGKRGIGFCRANNFGENFEPYFKQANQVTIVAQIEDIRAVNNLDAILSVKGLDAVMVGPYDLSGSMNLTGQFDHPDFVQVMEDISARANAHKIPMGLHIVQPDRDLLEQKIDQGYQFIAYGIDALFLYRAAQNPIQVKDVL